MGSSYLSFIMFTSRLTLACVLLALTGADFVGHRGGRGGHHASHGQLARTGRQEEPAVQGGIDFSGCEEDPETGLCCVEKEETVTSLEKEPILECTHKNVEQCHYTYITQFTPSQPKQVDSSVGLPSKLPDGLLRPEDSRLHRAHYVATTLITL